MGRKKVYESEHKRHEAEKRRKREWYRRNEDHVKKCRMERYFRNKEMEEKLS